MCPGNCWIGGTPLDGRDILAGGQSPAGNQQPEGGGNCVPVSIKTPACATAVYTDARLLEGRTSHKTLTTETIVQSPSVIRASAPPPSILVDGQLAGIGEYLPRPLHQPEQCHQRCQ